MKVFLDFKNTSYEGMFGDIIIPFFFSNWKQVSLVEAEAVIVDNVEILVAYRRRFPEKRFAIIGDDIVSGWDDVVIIQVGSVMTGLTQLLLN